MDMGYGIWQKFLAYFFVASFTFASHLFLLSANKLPLFLQDGGVFCVEKCNFKKS